MQVAYLAHTGAVGMMWCGGCVLVRLHDGFWRLGGHGVIGDSLSGMEISNSKSKPQMYANEPLSADFWNGLSGFISPE
jgi:hypothetical protein